MVHFPLCSSPWRQAKNRKGGRLFEPQASSRPDRFFDLMPGGSRRPARWGVFSLVHSFARAKKELAAGQSRLAWLTECYTARLDLAFVLHLFKG